VFVVVVAVVVGGVGVPCEVDCSSGNIVGSECTALGWKAEAARLTTIYRLSILLFSI
jgi:hypothetical protein